MELVKFKGALYGKLGNQLFIWEPSWDSFRPITGIGWDGKKLVPIDKWYKENIFCPWYGYGTAEMKKLCQRLTDITELNVPEGPIPWLKGKWWRDRNCTFAFDCSSKSADSWRRYIAYTDSRARTLRRHHDRRATKRLVPK